MKTKLLISGIIAFIVSLIFDKTVMQWSVNLRIGFLNPVIQLITHSGFVILFIAVMFIVLLKRKQSLVLVASALLAYYAGVILKIIIARPRPEISKLVSAGFYSMPSTHAMAMFALIPVLQKEYPGLLWLWIVIAAVVAFSRFYIGVHYLSDLLLGAILGYMAGMLVLWINKKYKFGVI